MELLWETLFILKEDTNSYYFCILWRSSSFQRWTPWSKKNFGKERTGFPVFEWETALFSFLLRMTFLQHLLSQVDYWNNLWYAKRMLVSSLGAGLPLSGLGTTSLSTLCERAGDSITLSLREALHSWGLLPTSLFLSLLPSPPRDEACQGVMELK